MAIHYFEIDVNSKLKQKRKLSNFLKSLINQELPHIKKIDLSYIFCNDAYLLTINQDFLQHDTYTDIITFDLSDQPNHLTGELYISIDRIADNALKFDTTYEKELHRVVFHGALHLCGYKDKTATQISEMRSLEEKCLTDYFSLENLKN